MPVWQPAGGSSSSSRLPITPVTRVHPPLHSSQPAFLPLSKMAFICPLLCGLGKSKKSGQTPFAQLPPSNFLLTLPQSPAHVTKHPSNPEDISGRKKVRYNASRTYAYAHDNTTAWSSKAKRGNAGRRHHQELEEIGTHNCHSLISDAVWPVGAVASTC
eukprot:scaffold1882_cov164-Alexandrium_tamarense.AAC.5